MASPCTDSFIWKKLELELRGLTPGVVGRITEIIDQMMGKFKFTFFEEPLPADSLGPVAHALVFVGAGGVGLDDPLDGRGGLFGQRGISLGRKATTTLENLGVLMRLETLPPTIRTIPSPSLSASGSEGHMV
jgi:hypothetical protein